MQTDTVNESYIIQHQLHLNLVYAVAETPIEETLSSILNRYFWKGLTQKFPPTHFFTEVSEHSHNMHANVTSVEAVFLT